MMHIEKKLHALLADFPGDAAVLWQEMDGPICFEEGAHTPFVAASMIKVPILLHLLHRVQAEELSFAQPLSLRPENILADSIVFERGWREITVEEAARWMMLTSDNTCTNALIGMLGMEGVNESCARLDLHETVLTRAMLDYEAVAAGRNNYTSLADQYALFHALLYGSNLEPRLRAWAADVLSRCRDNSLLLRYIAASLRFVHKTGSLAGIAHDAGVFLLEHGAYFLGVFTSKCADETTAHRFASEVGEAVYRAYRA